MKIRVWVLVPFIIIVTLALLTNFMCSYVMDTHDMELLKNFEMESPTNLMKLPPTYPGVHTLLVKQETPILQYLADLSNLLFTIFNTAFGLVILCACGRNAITATIHGVLHVAVFASLVLRLYVTNDQGYDFYMEFRLSVYLLLALYVMQFAIAFCLVVLRQKFTGTQVERLCIQHAVLGLIIFFALLFNFFLHIALISANHGIIKHPKPPEPGSYLFLMLRPWIVGVFVYIYALFIILVLLLPISDMKIESKQTQNNKNDSIL